jgi:hypothetical protein
MPKLLVRCSEILELRLLRDDEKDFPKDDLKESPFGNWTGFYDWLRSDADSVVGIRYWPFEEATTLISRIDLRSVKNDSTGALTFFFTSQHQFDEQISSDQAFEESRILVGYKEQDIAFVFGGSDLTRQEWESITAAIDGNSEIQ